MLASVVLLLTGCSCYNLMMKKLVDVKVSSNPSVLALKGNSVDADVTLEFPAKFVRKKAILRVTPIMVYNGGEITGTPKYFQGEKVKDNYTVVPFKVSSKSNMAVSIPYNDNLKLATLELRLEAKCKNGAYRVIGVVTVAQGVTNLQRLADLSSFMTVMSHNYKRITPISQTADINYIINKSNVRPAELTKEQIALFESFVREHNANAKSNLNSIDAKGYASPDGPVSFNDQLSRDRSETGKAAISDKLSGVNARYDVAAYGEDWEGFRDLVAASNIKEKDLILQVLNMYSNPVRRDEEIHKMSAVFEVLKTDILPQLRRTQLVANVDLEGRTDAEIATAVNNNTNALSVEELLYAATFTSLDDNAKVKALQAATRFNDARAFNNLGVVLARQGKLTEAKAAFDRAASIDRSADITNNLAVLSIMSGDAANAQRMLGSLNTANARANQGLVQLIQGNSVEAARSLQGYNLAVAETMNGNYSRAKSLLANETSANADYLKAVIAMREGDTNAALANLRSSISKDSRKKSEALTDVEFARIFSNPQFKALVG